MTRLKVLSLAGLAGALFTACPQQGVVCQPGTNACGDGCADFTADTRNCGGCGLACQTGEICQNSQCLCAEGATQCGGRCVVLATDSQNCGACGNACVEGQVCEPNATGGGSSCKTSCELTSSVQCGASCVDTQTDRNNCGGCGVSCEDGRSCKQGVCNYDAVLSCHNFGQVVGFSYTDGGVFVGPRQNLGTTPIALAATSNVLFALDDTDNRVLQASLQSFQQLRADAGAVATGTVPTQVVAAPPYLFVVNSGSGTLQILQMSGAAQDGGYPDGFALTATSEYNFGPNTYPEGVALIGSGAFVPLYGGFSGASVDAGQKVVKVDISNPAAPADAGLWDLNLLDLEPFGDAGSGIPRPFAITAFQGKAYAVLNNLNSDPFPKPAGPGMLAEIDPASGTPGKVSLGAECLNPGWAASSGGELFVSCTGSVNYDPVTFAATSVDGNGVAMLKKGTSGQLEVVSRWVPTCPASTTCPVPVLGRLAAANGRVVVTDQSSGQSWVLQSSGGQLTEVPNAAPLQACPVPDNVNTFYSNVGDVVAIP